MTKQVLEIEVPNGKKAVWKNDRVVFEDANNIECIKTIDDAIYFLSNNGICKDILDSLFRLPKDSFEWKVAAYRAVVAAVTNNEQRHLATGECWYPIIEACYPGKSNNCYGDTILGRIKSEGKEFDIVGGHATHGSSAGLLYFYSDESVSYSWTNVGFLSVSSKEAAEYISRQFGKLLFEISYGGVNCNWEWVK